MEDPGAIRRLPVGAEVREDGVHFRVWAPDRERVEVLTGAPGKERAASLRAEAEGYFSLFVPGIGAGTLYRFRLDGADAAWPDPASRCQPEGPAGPSRVVDAAAFTWSDGHWQGAMLPGQVLYELHVGTFTQAGTFAAATAELEGLASLGVTAVELMPLAECAGPFNWGYDGVHLFAPSHHYGSPDDLRRLVDRAHSLGLAVLLDLVCNHLGPEGNCLPAFSPHYFSRKHATDWGAGINFDGPHAQGVRDFYLANVAHWIGEYHLDGLRLDATQDVHDSSRPHILQAIVRRARAEAGRRAIMIIAENEPQDVELLRPAEQGGHGMDALWNDDFHHSATVALTGRREAYYSDHLGTPQEFVSAAKRGTLFQGQWYSHQGQRRGTPTRGLPPRCFVNYLQNHDQVANSGAGARLHQLTSPGRWRAMTALLLLLPGTPLLFQGQEFGASSPFLYFADPKEDLREPVRQGRASFLAQFPSLADPEVQRRLADPSLPSTFERCKLDPAERSNHTRELALHRDLLRLRREDPVFGAQAAGGLDGAVLAGEAFVLRWFDEQQRDRLLLVNLGIDLCLETLPEPLLAPPAARRWTTLWSSENPVYGGGGTPVIDSGPWRVPGHCAVVLAAEEWRES